MIFNCDFSCNSSYSLYPKRLENFRVFPVHKNGDTICVINSSPLKIHQPCYFLPTSHLNSINFVFQTSTRVAERCFMSHAAQRIHSRSPWAHESLILKRTFLDFLKVIDHVLFSRPVSYLSSLNFHPISHPKLRAFSAQYYSSSQLTSWNHLSGTLPLSKK